MSGIPTLRKKVVGMLEERIALLQEGILEGEISIKSAQRLEVEIDTLYRKYMQVADSLLFQYQTWGQVDQLAALEAEKERYYEKMDLIRKSVQHYSAAVDQGVFDTRELEMTLQDISFHASVDGEKKKKLFAPCPGIEEDTKLLGSSEDTTEKKDMIHDCTGTQQAGFSRARSTAAVEEKRELGKLLIEAEKTYQEIKTRMENLGEVAVTEEDVIANMYPTSVPQRAGVQRLIRPAFDPTAMSTPQSRPHVQFENERRLQLRSDQELMYHQEEIIQEEEPSYFKHTTPTVHEEQGAGNRRVRVLKQEVKSVEGVSVDPSNDGRTTGLALKREEKQKCNTQMDLANEGKDTRTVNHGEESAQESSGINATFGYSDVPKHLKNIPLKKFSGNKRQFETWWSAFMACVDAPAHIRDEIKMLKLLDMVEGEALETIENLGVSASAYSVAKRRLTRKFGGKQRQLNIHWTDMMEFRQIKDDSPVDVEKLAETMDRLVVYLQDNNESHELGGGTLYSMILRKLNRSMSTNYQRWLHEKGERGTVLTLYDFINKEAEFMVNAVESMQGLSVTKKKKDTGKTYTGSAKPSQPSGSSVGKSDKKIERKCLMGCTDSHGLWTCKRFLALDINKRWEKVKELKVCFKCLQSGHQQDTCRRGRPCGTAGCSLQHNKLLHNPEAKGFQKTESLTDVKTPAQVSASPLNSMAVQAGSSLVPTKESILEGLTENTEVKNAGHTYHGNLDDGSPEGNIAYRTVPVMLSSEAGTVKVVALLDDSSNTSYMSDRVANQLRLKGPYTNLHVKVVGDKVQKFNSQLVHCKLKSLDGAVEETFYAYTLKNVAEELKVVNYNRLKRSWDHLRDIVFPTVTSSHVDILMGLEYVSLMRSLKDVGGGKNPSDPIARLTPLGWTCVGVMCKKNSFTFHGCAKSDTELLLRKFWETEDTSTSISMTAEEDLAMKKVQASIKYIDGRYQVGLPWKGERPVGDSINNYGRALKRLDQQDRRFKKDPELSHGYYDVFRDYAAHDILRKIKVKDPWKYPGHFLAHFPVVRYHVATTKVRPVMDASDEDENGVSLNDLLLCGPALQQALPKVLCRFRRYSSAFITDIERMYMQILVDPLDRPYQCILLRPEGSEGPPEIWQFQRVVFGMNCSPFLAQFVARYNATLFADVYPRAVDVILLSTYMDDSQDSFRSVSSSIEVSREVSLIWNHAGMKPRKWLSNREELLASMPSTEIAKSVDLLRHELPVTKTLGMNWYPKEDILKYVVATIDQLVPATKRKFLKVLATVYDPLGLAVPVTVIGRILLQRVWEKGYDWDEEIAPSLAEKMNDWIEDMVHLGELIINRVLFPEAIQDVSEIQVHGFADSSNEAYGGVVYVRVEKKNKEVTCRMVMARVKVTPLKAITMPRLELMAALITARLVKTTMIYLQLSPTEVRCFLWTDSMDCLYWIHSTSKYLKPFIGHRVAEIQSLYPPEVWQHVGTAQNPADILSRVLPAAKLKTATLWWDGPDFLQEDMEKWPRVDISKEEDVTATTKRATKKASFHSHLSRGYSDVKISDLLDIYKFSSWTRLVQTVARLHLAAEIFKNRQRSKVLSTDDITWAAVVLLRDHQLRMYPKEMKVLETGRGMVTSSDLSGLNPWVDMEGLMRSRTRLADSKLVPWYTRFPVILAPRDHISQLIVRYYHCEAKHGGTGLTLSFMSKRFWMLSGREEIRRWERQCMVCIRANKAPVKVQMAPLPGYRTEMVSYAFQNTSIDYAGPFSTVQGRGRARQKRYICLFTCLSIRAIHLEMVWSCNTDAFLLAFTRFTDRRGRPEKVYTDNGPNLVGGANVIHELRASLDEKRIQEKTAAKQIQWHFQPPLAPHFSGVHEVMVKAAKRAMYQSLNAADFTDEELMSVACEAENMLNERPLTYQSSNSADHIPLCPNNFILGRLNVSMTPEAAGTSRSALMTRWRHVQDLADIYWDRWIAEWISSLSPRKKWRDIGEEVNEGDVALILDQSLPRGSWLMGRVMKTYPGSDGHVRVVDLKTRNGIMKRPVVKICKLC